MTTTVFLHGWGATSATWGTVAQFFRAQGDCLFIDFDCAPTAVLTLDDYADFAEKQILEFLTSGGDSPFKERGGTRSVMTHEVRHMAEPSLARRDAIQGYVPSINIIGHSFGARVAVLLATRHPNLINRLVLTGAAGLRPRRSLRRWARIKIYKWFKIGRGSADYRRLTPAGKRTFQNIIHRDLAPEIARITAPTLLLWGKRDKSTPLYMGKRWTKLLQRAILKVYPRAGHFAFLDAPARFIHDAYQFLDGGL